MKHLHVHKLQSSLNSCWGFSLVQILVSTAIGGLLVVLIAQLAGSSVRNVSESTGRMESTAQLDHLRERLAADLARVPHPATVGRATLRLSANGTLTLQLPGADSLEPVLYEWSKPAQTLVRKNAAARETIATGVQSLQLMALATGADATGPMEWSSDKGLPAAMLCRARIGSTADSASPGRDYEVVLSVGGGR